MLARSTVDPLRFAHTSESITGKVPLAKFDRLVDGLVSDQGKVQFRLQGGADSGRPVLRLQIDAAVTLRCQYCREPYRHELRIERVLPLARNEAELARWERDDPLLDALLAVPSLDVLALIEDEILLSLPVAPRHLDGDCGGVGA